MLDAPLVDTVLEWFPDVLWSVITDNLVGSAEPYHSFSDFLCDVLTCSKKKRLLVN